MVLVVVARLLLNTALVLFDSKLAAGTLATAEIVAPAVIRLSSIVRVNSLDFEDAVTSGSLIVWVIVSIEVEGL